MKSRFDEKPPHQVRLVFRLAPLCLNSVPFGKKILLHSNLVLFQFQFLHSSQKWARLPEL
jgi:hypothetical protein